MSPCLRVENDGSCHCVALPSSFLPRLGFAKRTRMRIRYGVSCLAVLAVPLLLSGCPEEPTTNVLPPPQPTATASATATAVVAVPEEPRTPPYENPGGMWMPEQMPLHEATLKTLGMKLDPKSLANLDGVPLGAIISLGGCTASFVSADGLAITNHHCSSGWLNYATTPKNDYASNGVNPKTRADEVWAGPSARAFVTTSMRDVTAEVRAGIDKIKSDVDRLREVEKHTKALVSACEKDRPQVRCSVVPYFGGGSYRLIEQLEMKDLRLSYVPPESIGDYGGEVDNWRWPRHGGDFAFFRVYVGKDGQPADHAETNVPYKPKAHLSFPSVPLRTGDLVFMAGYPGTTSRLKVAAEVEELTMQGFPSRIESFETFLPVFEGFAAKSKELKVKTGNMVGGLYIGLIKMRGVVDTLKKGGRIEDRKKAEAELAAYIDSNDLRKSQWGDVIPAMTARVRALDKYRVHDTAARELFFMPRLFLSALQIVRTAEEREKPDAARHPDYQERNYKRFTDGTATFQKSYDADVEKAVMTLALERVAKLPAADQPAFAKKLLGKAKTHDDIAKLAAAVYDTTKLGEVDVRKELLTKGKVADLKKRKDPLLDLAIAARKTQKELQDREEALAGAFLLLAPRYADASRAFARSKGKPDVAPDANGTLRITYGTVRGYKPTPDAPLFTPFTTLAELAKKHTGKDPFNAPKAELDAIQAGQKGPYLFSEVNDVPVDFLTDLDITGGNSGSPTFNAKGEVVGLGFDGTYEGVASDWLFLPDTTRAIHVDSRYILWVMDAVSGAGDLLRELGRTPTFAK